MMQMAASKAMKALEGLDAAKVKSISIIFSDSKGEEEPEDEEEDISEEKTADQCPECGCEMEEGECPECGYEAEDKSEKPLKNPDKDVEGKGDVDSQSVRRQEYGASKQGRFMKGKYNG